MVIAVGTSSGSERIKTTSAVSIRHVGAGADRDAQVGLSERRSIVDAVADHRHLLSRLLEVGDSTRLVTGQHLRNDRRDAELATDALRRRPVVAALNITTSTPCSLSAATAAVAVGRGASLMPTRPAARRSIATRTTVLPSPAI
jgi:hypothetical protein